jgi:hypothetical protein
MQLNCRVKDTLANRRQERILHGPFGRGCVSNVMVHELMGACRSE